MLLCILLLKSSVFVPATREVSYIASQTDWPCFAREHFLHKIATVLKSSLTCRHHGWFQGVLIRLPFNESFLLNRQLNVPTRVIPAKAGYAVIVPGESRFGGLVVRYAIRWRSCSLPGFKRLSLARDTSKDTWGALGWRGSRGPTLPQSRGACEGEKGCPAALSLSAIVRVPGGF